MFAKSAGLLILAVGIAKTVIKRLLRSPLCWPSVENITVRDVVESKDKCEGAGCVLLGEGLGQNEAVFSISNALSSR
jgi:hypothetical protein